MTKTKLLLGVGVWCLSIMTALAQPAPADVLRITGHREEIVLISRAAKSACRSTIPKHFKAIR